MGRRCSCAGPERQSGVCRVVEDVDIDFLSLDAFLGGDWWCISPEGLKLKHNRLTFLPTPDTLHTNEHSDTRDFMSPINVVLQRDESIQLLAVSVSEGRFTQDTFIAVFLHHEVAAVVPLGEDGGN